MIKTLILDDEPLALDILETYINDIPELELVARSNKPMEALNILKSEQIDLLFLDIQMPGLTGIELIKSLPKKPATIFTTAYSEYALEGFELDAIDYLLKPISKERFLRAVFKAQDYLAKEAAPENTDFFFVKADKKLIKVHYDDILYVEGLKDYVIIKMMDSRIITLQTMKSLEQKLPSHIFQRVHRSYIANITKVKALVGNSLEIVEKKQTKIVPIGKNYREHIFQLINKNRL